MKTTKTSVSIDKLHRLLTDGSLEIFLKLVGLKKQFEQVTSSKISNSFFDRQTELGNFSRIFVGQWNFLWATLASFFYPIVFCVGNKSLSFHTDKLFISR